MAKLICAIDTSDKTQASLMIEKLSPHVDCIKLGLEFFTSHDRGAVADYCKNQKVFLDLKLHDIPNTVMKAAKNVCELSPYFLTLHASGGYDMLQAAVRMKSEHGYATKLLAVTVLTSLSDSDLKSLGWQRVEDQVKRYAEIALKAGCDGLVCSPWEIKMLRSEFGRDFDLVCPGIRLHENSTDDQKRICTPEKAAEWGASYLVIGRALTNAEDPEVIAKNIRNCI